MKKEGMAPRHRIQKPVQPLVIIIAHGAHLIIELLLCPLINPDWIKKKGPYIRLFSGKAMENWIEKRGLIWGQTVAVLLQALGQKDAVVTGDFVARTREMRNALLSFQSLLLIVLGNNLRI